MAADKREVYALRSIKSGGVRYARGDLVDISEWPNPQPWFDNGVISKEPPFDRRKKAAPKPAPEVEPEEAQDAVGFPPAAAGTECPYCGRKHRTDDAAANCAKRASEANA